MLAWLQIIPCGLFGVSAYFVPNSPYWLVEQGRHEDAEIALRQLRGPHYDLAAELAEMVEKKRVKDKKVDNVKDVEKEVEEEVEKEKVSKTYREMFDVLAAVVLVDRVSDPDNNVAVASVG